MKTRLVITALAAMLLFAVAGFAQDQGGPDLYGYTWKNSDATDGPAYAWVEPDTTNDAVALYTAFDDDGNTPMLPLNFTFPFYGTDYTEVMIGSNGIIGFTDSNMSSLGNQDIPNTSTPNNIIAWFWDDLNPRYTWTSSHCYFENITYNDMNAFMISFVDYSEYLDTGDTGTYPEDCIQAQVILVENGDILINYDWIGSDVDLTSSTIGIENVDGTDALQYGYNEAEGINIADDFTIAFYYPIFMDNDLRASTITGSEVIDANVESTFTVTVLNNGTLAQDTYSVLLMVDDVEVASATGTEIQPGQSIDFDLNWTPSTGGYYMLKGVTVLDGDEITDNDASQPFEVFVNPSNDLTATKIYGNAIPDVNQSTTYTVTVLNSGLNAQSTYTVYLKDADGNELASIAGTSLAAGDSLDFNIDWTPTAPGYFDLHGEVSLDGDEIAENDSSLELGVRAIQSGFETVELGDGTVSANTLPINFYYKNSLSQTIYYPEELNISAGTELIAIKYFNDFPETQPLYNKAINIWVGETELETLVDGFIPSTELTQVFSGLIYCTAGIGEVDIPLETPWTYDGGNLVVMIQRPFDVGYYSSSSKFYYTTTETYPDRTARAQNDLTVFDPATPPAATVSSTIPNTTLYFGNAVVTGIGGYVYDSMTSPISGATVTLTPGDVEFTTDASGFYSFTGIDPGTYGVTAEAAGFVSHTENDLVVVDGEMYDYNFYLDAVMTVTITVTTNAGSPEGAALSFSNGTDTYEETVPESGIVYFYEIDNGTYTLEISLDDFETYTDNNVVVDGTTDIDVELVELIIPASNPACTIDGYFTWDAPELPVNVMRKSNAHKQVVANKTRSNKASKIIETMDRSFQHYNIYLGETLITTTSNTNYQFDTSGMTVGQSYTAGVGAQYESGESDVVTVDFIYGQETLYAPINVVCDSTGYLTWESGQPAVLLRNSKASKNTGTMDRDFIQYRIYLDDEYVDWTLNTHFEFDGLVVNTTYTAGVSAYYTSGNSTITEVEFVYMPQSNNADEVVPATTGIIGNYPNPFNPETNIQFSLSTAGQTSLTIYNVKGQKVRTLFSGHLEAKVHNLAWNGKDDSGKSVTSGVYYAVLKSAGAATGVQKMLLLK